MATYDRMQVFRLDHHGVQSCNRLFPGVLADAIPTGGDDGNGWTFNDTGFRRAQSDWGVVGASLTNPATLIAVNDLAEGERVLLSGFTDAGWSDLNDTYQTAVNVNSNAFDLQGVDATSFATYTGGATASGTIDRVHARLVSPVTGLDLHNDSGGTYTGPNTTAQYELRVNGALSGANAGEWTGNVQLGGAAANEVLVPVGALDMTGYAPSVQAVIANEALVPVGSLTMTGYAPSVQAVIANEALVPLGSLSMTGHAPSAVTTLGNAAEVPAGALDLTGYAPTVEFVTGNEVQVPTGALSFLGYAPSVVVTEGHAVEVPSGAFSFIGYAPEVESVGPNVSLVPLGSMPFRGRAPTVEATGGQTTVTIQAVFFDAYESTELGDLAYEDSQAALYVLPSDVSDEPAPTGGMRDVHNRISQLTISRFGEDVQYTPQGTSIQHGDVFLVRGRRYEVKEIASAPGGLVRP